MFSNDTLTRFLAISSALLKISSFSKKSSLSIYSLTIFLAKEPIATPPALIPQRVANSVDYEFVPQDNKI